DGKVLATGAIDGKIWLWDVETGKALKQLSGHAKPPPNELNGRLDDDILLREFLMVFSADGKTLASWNCDHMLRVWDVPSGKQLRKHALQPKDDWYCFSGDGKTFSPSVGRKTANSDLNEEIRPPSPRTQSRYSTFECSPDGKLAADLNGNTILMFDMATGDQ